MTGKEALKEIRLVRVYIDEFGCAVPLKKVKEYKIIENELDELTKYKRAFEILKEYSHLPPLEKFVYEEDGNYYAARIEEYDVGSDIPVTYHYLLDKEDYELLEELMDYENTK